MTLIVPEPRKRVSETQRSSSLIPTSAWPTWQVSPAPYQAPPLPPKQRVAMYNTPSIRAAIEHFTRQVANVSGVKCIVVEEAEGQIIHVTTFADALTEDSRNAVYKIEAETISSFADLTFDFHLRLASEVEGGTPIPIPGQRYFAVWGDLNANAR